MSAKSAIMHRRMGQSGFSPLKIATPTHQHSARFDHYETLEEVQSPQSSTCVRSTSSQDPVLTRSELISIMETISDFALHYATVYHGIGRAYHTLPFSARHSKYIVSEIRGIVELALNASHYKQLPDLVYVFSEISSRLNDSQKLLHNDRQDWQMSEVHLRRCDMLLQEAEVRLRFVQAGVWNMWYVVGKDEKVHFDEGDDAARAKRAFENRWLVVLPPMCFADHKDSDLQNNTSRDSQGGRRWTSWSGWSGRADDTSSMPRLPVRPREA